MKITLTGSLGNTGKPLAEILIKAGHEVTVISSNADRKKDIEAIGAKAAIGSVEDASFLAKAFTGADAVYTMIPPDLFTADYRAYARRTIAAYIGAIQEAGVRRVVNLSSIGAHLPAGTGPIAGLHEAENSFSTLEGVGITQLRAGFFYNNFFANMDMIRHAGIIGGNYGTDTTLMMVHPADIAAEAAEALQEPPTGKNMRYVVSDQRSVTEIAATLGKAIGKPELPWVNFSDEEALAGMLQAGLPEHFAGLYVEMGQAARNGKLWEHYSTQPKETKNTIPFEAFAATFAVAYQQA